LAGTAIPTPELIAGCEDASILGVPFYLMEVVDGFDPLGGLPTLHAGSAQLRRRMGLALVEPIAALAALDYAALGLGDFGDPRDFDARQLEKWQSILLGYERFAGWTGLAPLGDAPAIGRWLGDNVPAQFEPGIMHGDYHIANVMYRRDGPEIAAVVDWEMAVLGNPLFDLGWLVGTWPDADGVVRVRAMAGPGESHAVGIQPWTGFPSPRELVDHYARHSGRNLESILWYAAFACYKLGIILEEAHARACAGEIPRDMGNRLHNRAIFFFNRARRWIDGGLDGTGPKPGRVSRG
jgi:aminoglycoside phosphotransferase (APT) family kinase protein